MRQKRFTEEHVTGALNESEAGAKTRAICRRQGISEQTLPRRRSKSDCCGNSGIPLTSGGNDSTFPSDTQLGQSTVDRKYRAEVYRWL